MTDRERIEQAAKNYRLNEQEERPDDVEFCEWDFKQGCVIERSHWQPIIAEKDNRIEHLLDVLHFERTGMAKALAGIVKLTESYRWITEGRGPYAYNDDEYRKEAGYMLDSIEKTASDALSASGAIAHAECCQRERRSVTIENFDYIHKSESDKQLSEKDAAIKELVEGLEDALGSIDEGFSPYARERIKQLIAKYKKQ